MGTELDGSGPRPRRAQERRPGRVEEDTGTVHTIALQPETSDVDVLLQTSDVREAFEVQVQLVIELRRAADRGAVCPTVAIHSIPLHERPRRVSGPGPSPVCHCIPKRRGAQGPRREGDAVQAQARRGWWGAPARASDVGLQSQATGSDDGTRPPKPAAEVEQAGPSPACPLA